MEESKYFDVTNKYVNQYMTGKHLYTQHLRILFADRWYYWQGAAKKRGIPFEEFRYLAVQVLRDWEYFGIREMEYNKWEQRLINAVGSRYRYINDMNDDYILPYKMPSMFCKEEGVEPPIEVTDRIRREALIEGRKCKQYRERKYKR